VLTKILGGSMRKERLVETRKSFGKSKARKTVQWSKGALKKRTRGVGVKVRSYTLGNRAGEGINKESGVVPNKRRE